MDRIATYDDQRMIEQVLRRRSMQEPGIPAENVRKPIARLGQEIETGGLTKD